MTTRDAYILSLDHPFEFNQKKDYYESIIAKDYRYSYMYVTNVLEDRFEKGEYSMIDYIWYITNYMMFIKDKTPVYYKFI